MVKAVVAGAAGGIGQPLSLLLKTSTFIDELVVYDVFGLPGVLADLSHISTPVKLTGLPKNPGEAPPKDGTQFIGADIIIIPAGMPRQPGMTRDDLFNKNAGIVKGIIDQIADKAPNAFILVISNPVNSMVPVAAQALKKKGVFNPQRLFGVTTLDLVRARTFVAELTGTKNPQELTIPVIGGHSAHTIVPVLSQAKPAVKIPMNPIESMHGVSQIKDVGTKSRVLGFSNVVERIQFGGDEVVGAKEGKGSATLSMAYAAYTFAEKVLQAAKGAKGIVECTYVHLSGIPGGDAIAKETGCDFFSVPVELGTNGAEKAVNILGSLNSEEKELLKKCIDGYTKTTPGRWDTVTTTVKDEEGKPVIDKDTGKTKTETKEVFTEEKKEFQAGLKVNIEKGVDFKEPGPK